MGINVENEVFLIQQSWGLVIHLHYTAIYTAGQWPGVCWSQTDLGLNLRAHLLINCYFQKFLTWDLASSSRKYVMLFTRAATEALAQVSSWVRTCYDECSQQPAAAAPSGTTTAFKPRPCAPRAAPSTAPGLEPDQSCHHVPNTPQRSLTVWGSSYPVSLLLSFPLPFHRIRPESGPKALPLSGLSPFSFISHRCFHFYFYSGICFSENPSWYNSLYKIALKIGNNSIGPAFGSYWVQGPFNWQAL